MLLGMHATVPAPVWAEAHGAPATHLLGCVNRWRQLTRVTQYDKLPTFDIALNILEAWSEDSRLGKSAMNALWQSPRHSDLMASLEDLHQTQLAEIQGRARVYSGNSPPAAIPWNDGAWAPLPADLVKQLADQDAALSISEKSKK